MFWLIIVYNQLFVLSIYPFILYILNTSIINETENELVLKLNHFIII